MWMAVPDRLKTALPALAPSRMAITRFQKLQPFLGTKQKMRWCFLSTKNLFSGCGETAMQNKTPRKRIHAKVICNGTIRYTLPLNLMKFALIIIIIINSFMGCFSKLEYIAHLHHKAKNWNCQNKFASATESIAHLEEVRFERRFERCECVWWLNYAEETAPDRQCWIKK